MTGSNALIHETSPYLLQHAHNPVNWMPWSEQTLELAKREDKPILVSIGYSACHWCHVMEHESFEDTSVAKLMNESFICIKVDREERPDVDQVYMDAVQLMTGSGGWPLNCFALPDGRPFYGGTYFRKDQWMQALKQISTVYKNDREKAEEYAAKLTEGLSQMDQMPLVQIPDQFDDEVLETAVARWKRSFDMVEGGPNYAPKFPMPNNYQFLLSWAHAEKDLDLQSFVHLTLKKMARGGIYDQLGGGFARYSTDEYWKVPHFEKMLYDNAQLLSLYSQAYSISGKSEYEQIIEETAAWIRREMTADEGAFFSAQDADSEGEEGKFYTWSKDEIKALAGENFDVISDYYNVNKKGLWEHGRYILLRNESDAEVAAEHQLSEKQLQGIVQKFKINAFETRENRIHPGLDDKTLTSWNAMTAKGLLDAYAATGNLEWLKLAERNLNFLTSTQMASDAQLYHNYKDSRSTINGYLDDYAFLIDALLRHYELTFDESSIMNVKQLVEYVFVHFNQNDNGFFFFKSNLDPQLVAKKVEIHDNVIPASNSVLATCFYKLGLLLGDPTLIELSQRMLAQVEPNIAQYPTGHSQWMMLHQMNSQPYFEIAIVGKDCLQKLKELTKNYLPNAVICGGETEGRLPILEHRLVEGKTLIYVCQKGACKLPVETVEDALAQLVAN